MNTGITVEIPARPDYLSFVRSVVSSAAAIDPTFGDDRLDDLRLAVSEAVTNAIEAHLAAGNENRISITCEHEGDHVVVTVVDRGPGFTDDDLVPVPAPEEPERLEYESGLGVPLMRMLADEAEFRSDAAGTVVRLVVYPRPR